MWQDLSHPVTLYLHFLCNTGSWSSISQHNSRKSVFRRKMFLAQLGAFKCDCRHQHLYMSSSFALANNMKTENPWKPHLRDAEDPTKARPWAAGRVNHQYFAKHFKDLSDSMILFNELHQTYQKQYFEETFCWFMGYHCLSSRVENHSTQTPRRKTPQDTACLVTSCMSYMSCIA